MENGILEEEFYRGPAPKVAISLLGKVLYRLDHNSRPLRARITEVEAYLGEGDLASHSSRGKTRRNQSLFSAPGTCYVYLSYGLHHCINVVVDESMPGSAVLLRSAVALSDVSSFQDNRSNRMGADKILRGPGNLAKGFGFDMKDDGESFYGTRFWFADDGMIIDSESIMASTRVGITRSSDLMLRFSIGEPNASAPLIPRTLSCNQISHSKHLQ